MPRPKDSLWHSVPVDIAARIERCLARAREYNASRGPAAVFFRADDVAVPGRQLARLLSLFSSFHVPLALAVVPAWLTAARWQQIEKIASRTPQLWCWHQHGWRHANHEEKDKKQEFGPSRSAQRIKRDLALGRGRLESLLGREFYPVFTPPWNRCSADTLRLLEEMGYRAVSRSSGSLPPPPEGLPDIQVNLDLHTRRDPDSRCGWRRLLSDMEDALKSGTCGVMIHHRLMTGAAFDFLEILLKCVAAQKGIAVKDFREMAKYAPRPFSQDTVS